MSLGRSILRSCAFALVSGLGLVLPMGCGAPSGSVQAPAPPAQPQTKAWTILFYDAADWDGYDPFNDWCSRVRSTPNVNYLILRDTLSGEGQGIFAVGDSGGSTLVQALGEPDTGNPKTLADFISLAKAKYPAEHYALAVYDHGGGWLGACVDTGNGRGNPATWLTMPNLAQGLKDAGGVDALLFTAPCLMGSLESMFEVRKLAPWYVASEDLSGFTYWREPWRRLSDALAATPRMDAMTLARTALDAVAQTAPAGRPGMPDCTMSAVQSSAIEDLATAVDALSAWLLDQPTADLRTALVAAHGRVRGYDDVERDVVDLGDLVEQLRAEFPGGAFKALADQVQGALQKAILGEFHGPAQSGSHGISIYCPNPQTGTFLRAYADPESPFCPAFSKGNRWAKVLQSVCLKPTPITRPRIPAVDGDVPRLRRPRQAGH